MDCSILQQSIASVLYENMKNNRTKIIAVLLACIAIMQIVSGCAAPAPKQYEKREFMIRGFWLPNEINEEAFALYKQAGLNTVDFVNHTSREEADVYYIGSSKTLAALELCKKLDLDAVIHYGAFLGYIDSATPFTDVDYSAYRDIIKGVSIVDEPNKEHMAIYGDDSLTEDFKSAYSVPYMCNLYPTYVNLQQIGYSSYQEYLQDYAEKILQDFPDNRYISVDFYPFDAKNQREAKWLDCYNQVAKIAKQYGCEMQCYIQSATKNEFSEDLSEDDIRLQINVALCFGVSGYSYYCYAVPHNDMYSHCLLNQDGTPSELYYYAQTANAEAQSLASAFLSYKWKKSFGYTDTSDFNGSVAIAMLGEEADFTDMKFVENLTTDGDTLVGCFESTDGEGYMIVNYSMQDSDTQQITLKLKGGSRGVAIYGGKSKADGEIVMAKNGVVTLSLDPAEGIFVVPLH